MWFSENRLAWQEKTPETGGADTGQDTADTGGVDTGVDTADTGPKKESKEARDALDRKIDEDLQKKKEAANADKVADSAKTASGADKAPAKSTESPKPTEPVKREATEQDLADAWQRKDWFKVLTVGLALYFKYKITPSSTSDTEIEATKNTLIQQYSEVLKALSDADKLPKGIKPITELDVGVLSGKGIDSADKLKAFFESKSKIEITGEITLREYISKLESGGTVAPVVAATTVGAVAGTTQAVATEASTATAPVVPAKPEVKAPATPFKQSPSAEMIFDGVKMCPIELDTGESITIAGDKIFIGDKKFSLQASKNLPVVGATLFDVQFNSIKPDGNGGFECQLAKKGGGYEQSVPLTQEATINLVKGLYAQKDQKEFAYQVPNPSKPGENVDFKFVAV